MAASTLDPTTQATFYRRSYLLLHAVVEGSEGSAEVLGSTRAWAAALTITLTLAWWLMLAVELLALALGALAPTPPKPN